MGSATPPLAFRIKRHRDLRAAVFRRDNYTCRACGWRPHDEQIPADYDGRYAIGAWPHKAERILHVDHVRPRHAGGPNALENLQTLCESCNCRKSGRVEMA